MRYDISIDTHPELVVSLEAFLRGCGVPCTITCMEPEVAPAPEAVPADLEDAPYCDGCTQAPCVCTPAIPGNDFEHDLAPPPEQVAAAADAAAIQSAQPEPAPEPAPVVYPDVGPAYVMTLSTTAPVRAEIMPETWTTLCVSNMTADLEHHAVNFTFNGHHFRLATGGAPDVVNPDHGVDHTTVRLLLKIADKTIPCLVTIDESPVNHDVLVIGRDLINIILPPMENQENAVDVQGEQH